MKRRFWVLLAAFTLTTEFALIMCAQKSNDLAIDKVARHTAARLAKMQPHEVLILTVQGCLLDSDICGSLDSKIRAEVRKAIPGLRLLTRTDILPLLTKYGMLPVDGYTSAVEPVAVDLGADLMVTESLTGIEGGYEVSTNLTDLKKRIKVDEFKAEIARPHLGPSAEPLIFREPPVGPALVVPRRRDSTRKGAFPTCEKCPEPPFTDEARAKKIEGFVLLVATITTQGRAEQISVVRELGGGLTDSAVQTVRQWRFKPALGPDGYLLGTRIPIEVHFVLKN